jgi:hypothetical protein
MSISSFGRTGCSVIFRKEIEVMRGKDGKQNGGSAVKKSVFDVAAI